MKNQYIGVQKVTINHQDKKDVILIESLEEDLLTKVFTNGIRVDRIYPSPKEAYEASIHVLRLSGEDVELDIEIASNVMDANDVKDIFTNHGVNVIRTIFS